VNDEYYPYIGCVNESPDFLQKHYYGSIKGHTSLDLEFLEKLFNEAILPSQEECAVIKPLTSRRKYYGKYSITTHEPVPKYLRST
jgi:hypothetical protein